MINGHTEIANGDSLRMHIYSLSLAPQNIVDITRLGWLVLNENALITVLIIE